MIKSIVTLGMATLATGLGLAEAAAGPMSGSELKQAISGKHVYLAIPLGGEFPLYYRSSGEVDGTSPTSLLARLDPNTDTGKWWVTGDTLCQQWKIWYEQKRYCFTLKLTGPASLNWVRDDGFSGTARIAD